MSECAGRGGATCKHLRGKGRDPEAEWQLYCQSLNVKLSEIFDSFIFNMCLVCSRLVWWLWKSYLVIYLVHVIVLLLSSFKGDKKVKVHWKEWFNEKDDVGEVLLPAPATFLTNWLRFGVFLGQQQPAPCPSWPQWQCPQWVGFIM